MSGMELQGTEKKVTKGTLVYAEGQTIDELAVIVEGRLVSVSKGGRVELKKGSVIGLVEGLLGKRTSSYFADEDTTMIIYPYGSLEDNMNLSIESKINPGNMVTTAIRQTNHILDTTNAEIKRGKQFYVYVKEEYKRYIELCKGYNAECRRSEKILKLQESKQNLADSIIKKNDKTISGLSKEEILSLFK